MASLTGCWIWTGAAHDRGYGYFYTSKEFSNRKMDFAHRVSWFLYKGEKPPDELSVCHKCDVTSCVNPEHLFLGTHKDNMIDMRRKGRSKKYSKLTDKQVKHIVEEVANGGVVKEVARDYNISPSHCSRVSRDYNRYYKILSKEMRKLRDE